MTLTIILIYLALVLIIGLASHRLFRGTGEDYFVATRSIGPFVLLMSLFGTHMTAFALLGASGEAYHIGIGVFGLMASSSAVVVPAVFFFIGTRAWALGKKYGYITQIQYFRDRWGSDGLGLLLFIVLTGFMVPYLLIGVLGGGLTMNQITHGQVPAWAGGLLVSIVILCYVTFGGLRGTAWANTFQTLVFMVLGAATFFTVVDSVGGLSNGLAKVAEAHPELMIRGESVNRLMFASYMLIPLSVGMFPHIFMHWLSAKRAETFRHTVVFYPICLAIVWIPSVLLGLLGTSDFPGLTGGAANSILVRMIGLHAPDVLAGLLAAGVFAAIMSSLDSQVLSIGTMFTHDILAHYGFKDQMSERRQVWFGRLFVVLILLLTYLWSLMSNPSIFGLAIWSFTGFAGLIPVVVAALFWRRSTKVGAASAIIAVIVSWAFFFAQGWQVPGYSVGQTGLMPVAVILGLSSLAMVLGSLFSKAPEPIALAKFFEPSAQNVRQSVPLQSTPQTG